MGKVVKFTDCVIYVEEGQCIINKANNDWSMVDKIINSKTQCDYDVKFIDLHNHFTDDQLLAVLSSTYDILVKVGMIHEKEVSHLLDKDYAMSTGVKILLSVFACSNLKKQKPDVIYVLYNMEGLHNLLKEKIARMNEDFIILFNQDFKHEIPKEKVISYVTIEGVNMFNFYRTKL